MTITTCHILMSFFHMLKMNHEFEDVCLSYESLVEIGASIALHYPDANNMSIPDLNGNRTPYNLLQNAKS